MLYFLSFGAVLGISSGLSPGPLLALVISETLRHGVKAGVKVALAPIITDLPIIILTLLVLSKLSGFPEILGAISLAGGIFICTLGFGCIRAKRIETGMREAAPKSLAKGVLVNALSPHPYLFWLSVGAPTMAKAMSHGIGALPAFIVGFYASLVGSKILVAMLVGRSKSLLTGNAYIYTMRLLGVVLCALAVALFYDGLKLLGERHQ